MTSNYPSPPDSEKPSIRDACVRNVGWSASFLSAGAYGYGSWQELGMNHGLICTLLFVSGAVAAIICGEKKKIN